jgi:hypothetical protein
MVKCENEMSANFRNCLASDLCFRTFGSSDKYLSDRGGFNHVIVPPCRKWNALAVIGGCNVKAFSTFHPSTSITYLRSPKLSRPTSLRVLSKAKHITGRTRKAQDDETGARNCSCAGKSLSITWSTSSDSPYVENQCGSRRAGEKERIP